MSNESVTQLILDRYLFCPNVVDFKCDTWWRHDDCLVLWQLLYEINPDKYPKPPVEDNWHVKKMEILINKEKIEKMAGQVMYENAELLDQIGSDYDENGVAYWEKWESNE